MKILSIGTDGEVLNPQSDARARQLFYAPLINEMHIHCISKEPVQEGYDEKIADSITIYPVYAKNSLSAWMKSLYLCAKIIRDRNIDVVVSPDPFAKAWVCMLLAWRYKKKFLLSVYGGNIFDEHWKKLSIFNRVYSWIGRIVFRSADAIQTDGLETLDVLVQKYGKKVFWKPMVPANINDLLAIDRNHCLPADAAKKPNVLYVGRLIEQKNIPLLAKLIKEIQNDADVVVVGDGPEKPLLEGLNIRHYLKQDRSEIVERFKEADILILTSYYEGFARVMMEAGLAGVPVVTTEVSGIQGIVKDDVSGYVLKQDDEEGLIYSVKALITNPNKRMIMGQKIRDFAKEHLSVALMTEKQKAIFDYLKS